TSVQRVRISVASGEWQRPAARCVGDWQSELVGGDLVVRDQWEQLDLAGIKRIEA
ncbi:hypothetical protein Dimus_003881, partial [Dionaea muscipula]